MIEVCYRELVQDYSWW